MTDKDKHWSVTVCADGDEIVTIESNCLSGRQISPEDEETIRKAAHHLLAFAGNPTRSARPIHAPQQRTVQIGDPEGIWIMCQCGHLGRFDRRTIARHCDKDGKAIGACSICEREQLISLGTIRPFTGYHPAGDGRTGPPSLDSENLIYLLLQALPALENCAEENMGTPEQAADALLLADVRAHIALYDRVYREPRA